MQWILDNGLTILGYGGYVVIGIFAFVGYFKQGKDTRQSESDKLADGLILRLQQTVEQQGKDNKTLAEKLDQTTKELHQMQGRNEVLEKLFNGSEGSIMSFLKQAPKLIAIADENNALAKSTNASIAQLTETLNAFVKALPPLTPTIKP